MIPGCMCLPQKVQPDRLRVSSRPVSRVSFARLIACRFSVVKTYCGHGIGDLFHCAPNIPHYAHNKAVGIMKEGMVSAVVMSAGQRGRCVGQGGGRGC
jgi:methionine aminopeptidase